VVANFAHEPNQDGSDWLVSNVMPLVWAKQPDIDLTIVGADLPPLLREKFAAASPRVHLTGFAPDLTTYYNTARLAAAPLRFGAGIKGKVLEAWAAGIPCAMTPIAAEGLPLTSQIADTVADGADGLARLIVNLHSDAAWAERVGHAGRAVLRDKFSLKQERAALNAAASPAKQVDVGLQGNALRFA
jgi:glycosyltransferase involved in cell wall biosynthesis